MQYTKYINQKIEKIEFEYKQYTTTCIIKCEDTFFGFRMINDKKINKEKIEKFWNEIFDDKEVNNIKWCSYQNNPNRYLTHNGKEFVVDSDWSIICDNTGYDTESDSEEDDEKK